MPDKLASFDRRTFEAHLIRGRQHLAAGEHDQAIDAFEQAHLVGQHWTLPHTRSHLAFFASGWARRDAREIFGQLLRITWSALFTWLWVPRGNVGSTRMAAWRSDPQAADSSRPLSPANRRARS
jgi:hypothetical protein